MKSYEQLNLTVEELEKRLKYLKKDETTNLNGLDSRLSTVESNYSTLSSQTQTNTSNISSLQSTTQTNVGNITSLQNTVSTNSGNISSLQNLTQTHTGNISSLQNAIQTHAGNISSLQNTVSTNTNNITTLQNTVTSHTSSISSLDGRVETLENANCNSEIIETINCFDIKNFPMNLDTFGTYENFFTCFFTCETTSYVKLKLDFEIEINNSEQRAKTFNVLLNGTVIDSHSYTVNGIENKTYTVEYTFMPTSQNNNIQYKSTETTTTKRTCHTKLINCHVEICGRNIEILNHENDFKVFLSQNKYYITKNSGSTAEYKILNYGETDITSNYLSVPRPVYAIDDPLANSTDRYNYTFFNYQIYPVINFNSTTNKFEIDSSDLNIATVSCVGYNTLKSLMSTVPKHSTGMQRLSYSGEYSISSPGAKKSGDNFVIDTSAANTYAVKEKGNHYLIFTDGVTNLTSALYYQVTLNGVLVPGKWVHNEAVFAKDWETTPNRHYACVATNEFGENYLFTQREATYSLYIGKGSQTSAYMQSDGSINVYLSKANRIYKYVLNFNPISEKYEVASSNYVMDGRGYLEGYSNDYFYKKGETWYYVSPSQS